MDTDSPSPTLTTPQKGMLALDEPKKNDDASSRSVPRSSTPEPR